MPRKSYKPEEIVAKLRQVEVLTSQGQSVAEAIRSIGVSEVTYYRWRQEFVGLKSDQVKRLRELETENSRLGRAVSDLTLDKLILQEAAGETTKPRASPRLHRACSTRAVGFRASCLYGARTASLDAARGGVTTMPFARMPRSAAELPPRRCLRQHSPWPAAQSQPAPPAMLPLAPN